jgi:hypothetical protein
MRFGQVQHRDFITLVGAAAGLWPLAAQAQARPLIAWLSGGARPASIGFVEAFVEGGGKCILMMTTEIIILPVIFIKRSGVDLARQHRSHVGDSRM